MHSGKPTLFNIVAAVFVGAVCLSATAPAEAAGSRCLSVSDALLGGDDRSVELFLAAVGDQAGVVARLSCANGSLEQITLRAEPGQRSEVALALANVGFDPALISTAMTADAAWNAEWVHLEVLQAEVPAGGVLPISLVLAVPSDSEPGSRHEHRFDLVGEEGEILSVAVVLEVIAEQPMFRDGFDVDPVLGQFSYRSSPALNSGS